MDTVLDARQSRGRVAGVVLTMCRIDRLCFWSRTLAMLGLALGRVWSVEAATYSVNPTAVVLNASTRSALVTIKNESDQTLRFQLSVVSWAQDETGAMQLAPTEDVVFFPALLTLERGEERRVRVGAATPFAATEKTYRLFIEELPSSDRPNEPGAVRVLTKTGIPIFLQPARPAPAATATDVAVSAGGLSFVLVNTGHVHLPPNNVKVTATGADGAAVFSRESSVWYLLAGGRRVVTLKLSRPECERIVQLEVTYPAGSQIATARLATPGGACGDRR